MQCVIGKHKVKETKLGIYQIVLFMYQIDNERCELRIEYIPEILSIFGQYSEFSKEMAILGKIENCLTIVFYGNSEDIQLAIKMNYPF